MSRRRSYHPPQLPGFLEEYAASRTFDLHQYSEYHIRIMDGGLTCIDIWTTGKYWIKETNYNGVLVERQGEKGMIPLKKKPLFQFLDKIFFAIDLMEAK